MRRKTALGKWKAEQISSNFSSPAALLGLAFKIAKQLPHPVVRNQTVVLGGTDGCVFLEVSCCMVKCSETFP